MPDVPRPPETAGTRLRLARSKRGFTQTELAERSGVRQTVISKLEIGTMRDTTAWLQLSKALNVPPEWLQLGEGSAPLWEMPVDGASPGSEAHLLSDARATVVPQKLGWGDLMTESELPDSFTLPVRDQSLRELAVGDLVIFSRTAVPVPGKPILIVDAEGNHFIRRYTERRPGHWRATSDVEGLEDLEPERDGLEIIAAGVGTLWAT